MKTAELLDQVGIHLERYKALASLIDSHTEPDQIQALLAGLNENLEGCLDTASNALQLQV